MHTRGLPNAYGVCIKLRIFVVNEDLAMISLEIRPSPKIVQIISVFIYIYMP